MFGKKTSKLETVIGSQTFVQGTIRTKDSIRIDGKIEGGIIEASEIIIGSTGQIQGDMTAQNVIIAGKITGNITAYETLEIQPHAQIFGDIHCPLLSMDEGAIFEGRCVMSTGKEKVIEVDFEEHEQK